MAVSFGTYGPYDSGNGANITEGLWRNFTRRFRGDNVSRSGIIKSGNDCDVYADSTGLQVKGKTGEVWIEGAYGICSVETPLPIAVGHATLARKDRVVIRNDFVGNKIEWDVLQGTPGSGSPLALTQDATKWEISAAIVDVPALDNNIDAGQVTLAKHWQDWPHKTKLLTADVTKNNTNTLADVTDLQVELSANRSYAVEGTLYYESATAADARVKFTVPAGASIRLAVPALSTGTTFTNGNLEAAVTTSAFVSIGGAGAGVPIHAQVRAVVTTVDASGLLTMQWAQDTANVSDTILRGGSNFRITPLQ